MRKLLYNVVILLCNSNDIINAANKQSFLRKAKHHPDLLDKQEDQDRSYREPAFDEGIGQMERGVRSHTPQSATENTESERSGKLLETVFVFNAHVIAVTRIDCKGKTRTQSPRSYPKPPITSS